MKANIVSGGALIIFILFSSGRIAPCLSQEVLFTNEPVRVKNYKDAPLELTLVKTWIRDTSSKQWIETCFEYSVRNKTKKPIDSYSYDLGPEGKDPSVQGKSFMLPQPRKSIVDQACVPNDTSKDERSFVFQLSFVETKHKTIWGSNEHKKAFQNLQRSLEEFSAVNSK